MRELAEILQDFDDVRSSFKTFCKTGDGNKSTLLEFERRFVDLKSDITPWKSKLLSEYTRHDDKAATAIKYRIAAHIARGGYKDIDGTFQEKTSLSSAEKLAASTEQYQKFIQDRIFYKESYSNVSDVREDISSYINLIKDYLK